MDNHETFGGGEGGVSPGSGNVNSVTAGNASVVIGGTATNPTVRANLSSVVPQPVGKETIGVSLRESHDDHSHPVLQVAGITVGATQLSTLSSATMKEGTTCWVATVGAFFRLTTSALAVDGITVITASGAAGMQWLRVLQHNKTWESQLTWNVDPVNGSDEATGATSALAIKTLAELRRRWWSWQLKASATVNIFGNIPNTDCNAFNTKIAPGFQVFFIGTLGATTGGGGAAVNNTLFTGAVTTYTAGSAVPAADDVEMSDASIPVSFTASGLLAKGVIFRRTVTSTRHWYAVKDLGGKTIRITVPMNNAGPLNFAANPLTVGNAYSAFAMWTIPPQYFGAHDTLQVVFDTLHQIEGPSASPDEEGGAQGFAPIRRRCYVGTHTTAPFMTLGLVCTNCLFNTGGDTIYSFSTVIPPNLIGGGMIGTGVTRAIVFGTGGIGGAFVFQGCRLEVNDQATFTFEAGIAFHDTTASAVHTIGAGVVSISQVGISGKGNTSKLLASDVGGQILYGLNATLPPLVAGSSTDPSPVSIGTVSYAVVALPAVAETILSPQLQFPYGPRQLANGAVALALGATGPAGLPANPVRYVQVPDGAGGFYTFPSWT